MTPGQKIAEADKKFKQWVKAAYAKRDDKLELASQMQRASLNKRRKRNEQAN